jgi:cation transport ATPase
MLQLRKILAGSVIAYGTGVILWVAHTFTQALITEHIRVDLTIHSFALAILLVFFGASSVAIGVWYQRHQIRVFRVVMAVATALIIAAVYALAVVEQSSLITSLTILALLSVPPVAIGTYLLKPVR